MGGKGTEGKRGDAGSELAEFSQTDGEPLRKYKFPSFLVLRMASFQYSKLFYLITSHLDDSIREKTIHELSVKFILGDFSPGMHYKNITHRAYIM